VRTDWTEEQLEAALAQLRPAVAYPPTPALAAQVQRRLATAGTQPSRGLSLFRAWYAVAALLLVTLLIAVAWPEAREAVAERLGLRGVRITRVPELAPSPPAGDPRPQLGTPLDLEAARARVSFPVLVPTLDELGPPDEVYVNPAVPGGEVSLVYEPRPGLPEAAGTGLGLLISQAPGYGVSPVYEKGAGPETRLQSVRVRGQPGYWIDGAPHRFRYFGHDGMGEVVEQGPGVATLRVGEARLAANVLVWEEDGLTLRIESALPLDAALRIASSLR
jgi:hypothetical protein